MRQDRKISGESRPLNQRLTLQWDASLMLQACTEIAQGQLRIAHKILGEGADFRVILLQPTVNPIVLKIATPSFYERQIRRSGGFVKAMLRLETVQGPLIPPLKLLQVANILAYVMPYIPDKASIQDYKTERTRCMQVLGEHGLVLREAFQIRSLLGVPFIVDWSDIELSKQAGIYPTFDKVHSR